MASVPSGSVRISRVTLLYFSSGLRINRPWAIHKWFPTMQAMPKMIQELVANPELAAAAGGQFVIDQGAWTYAREQS
jgi:hypothetical protein